MANYFLTENTVEKTKANESDSTWYPSRNAEQKNCEGM